MTYIKERISAYKKTLEQEGISGTLIRILKFIKIAIYNVKTRATLKNGDFLFISDSYFDSPYRIRCENQAEQLRKCGLEGETIYHTALSMSMVDRYDFFFFFRTKHSSLIETFIKEAKKRGKFCIYDTDDLVFDVKHVKERPDTINLPTDEKTAILNDAKNRKIALSSCDYATVSTKVLSDAAKIYVRNVFINRNSVSDKYIRLCDKAQRRSKTDSEIILGYASGTATHNMDFQLIEDIILKIIKIYPNTKLMIIGPLTLSKKFNEVKHKIIFKNYVHWTKLPEIQANFTINLAPLEDTVFNNAKSELKFLEASLLRIPTVASKTEPFCHAIEHGKTSFIAKGKSDWMKYLSILIENRKLRQKMGKYAYEYVKRNYNTAERGEQLLSFIQQIKQASKTLKE